MYIRRRIAALILAVLLIFVALVVVEEIIRAVRTSPHTVTHTRTQIGTHTGAGAASVQVVSAAKGPDGGFRPPRATVLRTGEAAGSEASSAPGGMI